MERKTFVTICETRELDRHGHPGDWIMGMRLYDNYGNGVGRVALLPEYGHDELIQMSLENLLDIAREVDGTTMALATDLTVRGEKVVLDTPHGSPRF